MEPTHGPATALGLLTERLLATLLRDIQRDVAQPLEALLPAMAAALPGLNQEAQAAGARLLLQLEQDLARLRRVLERPPPAQTC